MVLCLVSRSTHVSHFLSDNVRVLSASDDKTVRIWDMASQSELVQFSDSTVSEMFVVTHVGWYI